MGASREHDFSSWYTGWQGARVHICLAPRLAALGACIQVAATSHAAHGSLCHALQGLDSAVTGARGS